MNGTVKWTLGDEACGLIVDVVATMDAEGNVTFAFETTYGTADLNGFFLDFFDDGGSINKIGSNANNMNGADCEGDKLDGFDYAAALGSVGGNDADVTSGSVTLTAAQLAEFGVTSMQDLALAEIGFRATSVGEDREGSLKLADTGTYYPPEGPPDDFFPLWGQDISNVILVFDQEEGDTKPRPDGDGYYTVKIDEWPGPASDDLDDSIDDILVWLQLNDPFVNATSDLLGVIIKGGQQDTDFFAFGIHDANGIAPDMPPDGLGLTWDGSENPQPANAVDASYNYDDVFAMA